MIQKLLEEFAKPFYRLNIGGIEIIPDSKKEFTGVSHRELFSFINDLLNVRACKIKKKQANRIQLQVMQKIAELIEYHKQEASEPYLTLKSISKLKKFELKVLNNYKRKMKKKHQDWIKILESNFTA